MFFFEESKQKDIFESFFKSNIIKNFLFSAQNNGCSATNNQQKSLRNYTKFSAATYYQFKVDDIAQQYSPIQQTNKNWYIYSQNLNVHL